MAKTKITRSDQYFKCPECGFTNKRYSMDFELTSTTEIVYCDSEEGGCDKQIVIKKKLKIETEVKAYKIEGLNN